jgi:Na+-translocating ferredoxin:NAD+ oxidoreductase RNF subunit RnfB
MKLEEIKSVEVREEMESWCDDCGYSGCEGLCENAIEWLEKIERHYS